MGENNGYFRHIEARRVRADNLALSSLRFFATIVEQSLTDDYEALEESVTW